MAKLTDYDLQRATNVWLENDKDMEEAARRLKIGYYALRHRLRKARKRNLIARTDTKQRLSDKKVYVITAAQDNTPVFEAFWENLNAYVKYRDAELIVGGFTYDHSLFTDHSAEHGVYDSRLGPFLLAEHRHLTEGLLYCGGANILPTSPNPIGGWETMSLEAWAIIPHARISLKSVPTMLDEEAKIVMTTGVVTEPNYVKRALGQKSEFHHTFGAVVVEIDDSGMFHCRHINAESSGTFYDLDVKVEHGKITTDNRVEAINWGDIHHAWLEDDMKIVCWNRSDSIIEQLQPKYQFIHDLLDFRARNHHNRNDVAFRKVLHGTDDDNVENEIIKASLWLSEIERDFCETVVVESNHDIALENWLSDVEAVHDPENVVFWHKCNMLRLEGLSKDKHYHLLKELIKEYVSDYDEEFRREPTFVREGESFKICLDSISPIQCGLHGHVGPNGSRGSATNLSKISSKLNVGHYHSATIVNGVYAAGVMASLRMRYNERGPSAWSHSLIVTYPNGKRTMITVRRDKKTGKLCWRK